MDLLDLALLRAWDSAGVRFAADPDAAARRMAGALGPTYARPLRSWALALRACDARIGPLRREMGRPVRVEPAGFVEIRPLLNAEAQRVTVTAAGVRVLCDGVKIPWRA